MDIQTRADADVTELAWQAYVAMRRIVENMGLAWQSQSEKLLTQKGKFNCQDIVTVGADGKQRAMLCMPVEKLQLWLASINPNKIARLDIRAKVEAHIACEHARMSFRVYRQRTLRSRLRR